MKYTKKPSKRKIFNNIIFEEVPEDVLDFHSLGILTREEIIFQVDQFIELSLAFGYSFVRIITGKGNVVRPTVYLQLKRTKKIKKFNYSSYFSGQDGSIDIWL